MTKIEEKKYYYTLKIINATKSSMDVKQIAGLNIQKMYNENIESKFKEE